jgi:hypothetical protein
MFNRNLLAVLVPIIASGCVSTVDIEAEDSVSFPNLDLSFPAGDDPVNRVRIRASRASGEFGQTLDLGEWIRVEDGSIAGPAEVDGELDLDYYSIAIGRDGRFERSEGVRSSWYIGVAQTSFDLSLTNGRRQFNIRDDTTEFYTQFGLYAEVYESLDFGMAWAFSLGSEFSGISEIDLLLEYRLHEHAMLSAGYRWLSYEYGNSDYDSDLEVDFRGPILGLHLPF